MAKTLIGKDNYLFLVNDSSNEIKKHCKNDFKGNLYHISLYYNQNNFLLLVYPDKSIIYNKYLPDNYKAIYRPILNHYKSILKDKLLDPYDDLKNEDDIYYKTDTHINLKGNYIVYNFFINKINNLLKLNLPLIDLNNLKKETVVSLSSLCKGIGDLTCENNLGNQILDNTTDNYYYDDIDELKYSESYLNINTNIKLLEYNSLKDKTEEHYNKLFNWDIISNYILYRKNDNCNNNFKVIIFFDSFMTFGMHLYLNLFKEIYFIKNIFDPNYVKNINPDYVFELRVERFLF